jgi:predicted PurR-regulated permease PerM
MLSLIPFVGAAAVWFPCCLYIAFIQETPDPEGVRTWMYARAGFLAIYGVGVISMADNVIKPWVLQGQSKLHPLLALLSVLGGVQALGPIGILVGPMVVAFLQVLLTMLQREITSLDEEMNVDSKERQGSTNQASTAMTSGLPEVEQAEKTT